jgi:hypothetical protein
MTILKRQKIDQWGRGAVGRPNDYLFPARRELAAAARLTPTFDW